MKRLLLVILCLLATLGSISCSTATTSVSGGYVQVGEERLVPKYAVKLGGETIGFDRYRHFFLNVADSMTDGMTPEEEAAFWTQEKVEELKTTVLTYLSNSVALAHYAKEAGVSLTDEEKKQAKDYVESVKNNLGDQYLQHLQVLYLTEDLYLDLQTDEKLYEKIFNFLFDEKGPLAWTNEKYLEYYHQNYLCATHVLIPFEAGETPENCPKTMEKAQEVYGLAQTTDFNQLIATYGKDENLKNFPTGYYFTKKDMVESFYNATAALEVGGISQPVITPEGVHVIRRLEPDKEQVGLQKQSILWGSSSTDGSYSAGVYAQLFEEFYTQKSQQELQKVEYNPQIADYLKPGLVF